jgi:hypothetical protein
MQQLRSVEAAHFVPGHGRTGTRWPDALDPQQHYFELILAETRSAIKRKRTLMEAVEEVGKSMINNICHIQAKLLQCRFPKKFWN